MKPIGTSVVSELVSAMSALNTEDENREGGKYLSEIHPMVAHAIEHIRSAIDVYNKEQKENNVCK
jgi:hypothetical protein